MREEIKNLIEKKVFIKLKNNEEIHGRLLSLDDPKSPTQFINILDNRDRPICIPIKRIKLIKRDNEITKV